MTSEPVQRDILGMTLPRSATVATGAVLFFTVFYVISSVLGLQEFIYAAGVRPMTVEGIRGTVFYSLAHVSVGHLVTNMVPLFILTMCICYLFGWRLWLAITLVTSVFSGWFCWFVGSPDTLIVGASGITSGLGVYLFFTAPFRRAFFSMVLGGVFTGVTVISIVSALTVGDATTSWQAHAGGVLAGVIFACIVNLLHEREKEATPLPTQVGTPPQF